jgi:hypothetical protein
MKCLRFIPIVLTAVCIFPAAAQQPDTPQPAPPSPQPDTQQSAPAQQSGSGGAVPAPAPPAAMQLAPVTAELTSKLDSKTAKAGDSVVLKTTEKATMADGTVIPKGSKIVGHVTEAQQFVANSDNGRVTLQFDQAEIKGGQTVPIKSAIQTVSPAAGAGAGADADNGMPSSGGGSTAPSGGGSASRPGAGSQGSTAGSASSPSQQATSPGMTGQEAQPAGPAPGTTVARNGNVVIKTTSVPGVLVASSVNGQPFSNASGALLSARQDVRLDGGTKMVLALASSGPGNPR